MGRLPEHGSVPEYVRIAKYWENQRLENPLMTTYSYDDFTILPNYSDLTTLDEVSIKSELVHGFPLEVPIVSSNMASVTEVDMAIFMARVGGIGIIHRAMSIEEQVWQVQKVKDATKFVVEDPPLVKSDTSVQQIREIMNERQRGFVLVVDEQGQLSGIITKRNVHDSIPQDCIANQVMRPREQLYVASPDTSMEKAINIMVQAGIEKLPLIDSEGNIGGVITEHDINMIGKYPLATKDNSGRLRVGAAIGIQEDAVERALALVAAGVDILVIDVLHGDAIKVHELAAYLAHNFPQLHNITLKIGKNVNVPIMAGNVCIGAAAKRLADAGAEASKVGYGDGAVCTTREVTQTGRGQATSVIESSAAVHNTNHKINADGSIRKPGHFAIAMSMADSAMVGTALAGTNESPGEVFTDEETGNQYKQHWGNASDRGRKDLAAARGVRPNGKRFAQGVETKIVYKGDAEIIIDKMIYGLKSAMANVGARNLDEYKRKVIYEIQPSAVQREGRPHFLENGHRR